MHYQLVHAPVLISKFVFICAEVFLTESASNARKAFSAFLEKEKLLTQNQYGVYCLQLFAHRRSSRS